MKIRYEWLCIGAEKFTGTVNGFGGVVSRVNFEVRAFDAGYVAPAPVALDPQPEKPLGDNSIVMAPVPAQPYGGFRGTVELEQPAIGADGFVSEDGITKALLLSWAMTELGKPNQKIYEGHAKDDLLSQTAPAVVAFMPSE